MTFETTSMVHVYFGSDEQKLPMGKLALQNRQILFEYDTEFLNTGLELSPFKLPLRPGVFTQSDPTFEGLFGVFNDSLPDGWGRLLLDRKLINLGLNPEMLSPLDRLCFVGQHGMGALSYVPDHSYKAIPDHTDLDEIANEIKAFQENDDDRFIEDLLQLGGSSAGARPKVLLHLDEEDWLIKFRSSMDPKDMGALEYAHHLMASDARLELPHSKLFLSRSCSGFFGTKRFDLAHGKRTHMHTVSGLLHADHSSPSLDYEMIMKATLFLTRDIRESEKQFRAAVFNVLSHNRDDHSKNFSFLMSEDGKWHVSPAYDLTFSSGPGGEHCSMIMGEGRQPRLQHLLQLASIGNIGKTDALQIIDEVTLAISKWQIFADEAGVSAVSRKRIQSELQKVLSEFYL